MKLQDIVRYPFDILKMTLVEATGGAQVLGVLMLGNGAAWFSLRGHRLTKAQPCP